MRVLLVVDIAYEAGGAEKSVRLIANALKERGHQVLVLSTDKNSLGKDIFADALVPAIQGNVLVRLAEHFWYPTAYKEVRKIVREFKPDAVHLHTISEFSPSLLYGLKGVPAVLTVHGPEEFTLELLPWLLPASDYKNGSYNWQDIRLVGRLRFVYYRCLQRPAYRLALRRLKLVIAPSKFMAKTLEADFSKAAIKQVYNGINLPAAQPLPAANQLLFIGRLEAVKGVDHLIKAVAAMAEANPKLRLRIVGDGSQRKELEKLATTLGINKNVDFAGWVTPSMIATEFKNASLLIIPSVWPENLPTVAIEALAIGRPIIGSNTGGVPELITAGQNGLIVTAGDDTALAKAISFYINNPKKLEGAALAARNKAQNFSFETFLKNLLIVYSNITK